MQDALTPIARPIEIPPPEKLQSSPPAETFLAQAEYPSDASTDVPESHFPPTSSYLDAAPSLELSTPPRRPSFSASKIEFQTPSPPKGLPELPGPPSEDDTGNVDALFASCKNDGLLNLTTAKTPRPPGGWAATPAPVPAPTRSQTPQPTSSSTRHSRTRSNSLPQPSSTEIQSSVATPTPALFHAGTLPARTPAPPGGWFSTPGSLRRKSLMKVRFETAPSDSSAVSDADATAKDNRRVEISLPEANWDITAPSGQGASESMSEPSFNNVESSSPAPALSASASGGDSQREDAFPVDSVNGTTVGSPSRRKLRRTPSVRLVDEYGRAQEDLPPSTPSRKDVREHSASMRMPGGGPLKTPRNTSVRIVDAMGHELEEPSEQNDSEDTVTEVRYTRQEALERMKRAVADLREGLNSVDTWVFGCSGICIHLTASTARVTDLWMTHGWVNCMTYRGQHGTCEPSSPRRYNRHKLRRSGTSMGP
jgi:serine/arginine repetitive matrix protein 2